MLLKRLRMSPHMLVFFALIIAGTVIRFILIYNNWPVTNSDEGNMGVLALHIAFQGEHPTFFYGLPYMGPVQGYVAALLFHLFGPSLQTLRLALLLMFPLFMVSMYLLTRLLYTRGLALFVLLLLALGSKDIMSWQLKAVGEYAELELCAALIALLAAWLALTSSAGESLYSQEESRLRWWRVASYAGLGFVVGGALWIDFLISPFVVMAAVLLWLFCRHELRSRMGLALLLGLIVGASPLIIFNVTAPLSQNSLTTLIQIHHGGADDMAMQHLPWIREFLGAALIGLPMLSGLNPRCPLVAFPTFGPSSSATVPCTVFYGSWAGGYILLGCTAAVLAGMVVWRLGRPVARRSWTPELRREVILHAARLMILASAGLTLLAYIMSPTAAVYTEATARYLICMVVVAPAILWPLWYGVSTLLRSAEIRARTFGMLRIGVLLYIAGMFVMGDIRTFQDIPAGQANYQHYGNMVQYLLSIGSTRIYSDYWTCNDLTFRSQEKVICAALDDHLRPGFDRYAPYRAAVRSAAHPTYVLVAHSAQVQSFELQSRSVLAGYQRHEIEGYVIYQPV